MIRKYEDKDILVGKFEIDVDDIFHLKNLYRMLHEWTIIEGFVDPEGKEPENYYWERRIGTLTEHQIWWRLVQTRDKNSYYRYFLKIDFQTLAMQGAEVMYEGKKVKTNKGELIIRVQTWLQLDYNNAWKDAPFLAKMDRIFRKRIHKQRLEQYRLHLREVTERLQNVIKHYLDLQMTYKPQQAFTPVKGV